jgi:outer membrane receptor protein involved in Fe transport
MMLFRASRLLSSISRFVLVPGIVLSMMLNLAIPAFAAGGSIGNVSGSVIDGTTKAPIAGAKVTLASPTGIYKATTDSNGHFSVDGLTVDTYSLSIQAQGYDGTSQSGINVAGDQTLDFGKISLLKLRTIVTVRSRSTSGAFQPGQTTDSYTIGAARQEEVLGKSDNTSENQLLLSVPGTSTTDSGRVTIRGGLANEVGYQLDGVPFTEPFLSQNGSAGTLNGLGSLQVVEGAGDATQGNIGSGVVNVIPKRGTYPGTGVVDFEIGTPNFDHQFGFSYGIASASGNISNYFSYIGNRGVPYYGYANSNVSNVNAYFGTGYQANDDLLDNFVFKFGKDNRQSLNILYDTRDLQDYGEVGGLTSSRLPYLFDPYTQNNGGFGFNPFGSTQLFEQYTGLTPYQTATNNLPAQTNQLTSFSPTHLLKFEYDNNLNDSTFLQLRYYNFDAQNGSSDVYDSSTNPTVSTTGGQRVGTNLELTHTIGQHTLTLQAQLENQKPQWNDYAPLETEDALLLGAASINDFLPGGLVYDKLGQIRLPVVGINYNGADFQTEGVGLRDQWSPTSNLKLDYGVRVDHANYKFGENPYNPGDPGNPSDVDPSFITNKVLHPTEVEPRLAVAFQLDPQDGIRASYGRSVEFLNAQDAGTPAGMYGAKGLSSVGVVPGTNTSDPATWTCGSGLNSARLLPSGANASGKGGGFFQCQNYAQQLFWQYDQNFDAPDVGNGTSPTYNNYDLSYQHQFKDGFGFKATGFYRLSTGLPGFFVLAQKTDPVTGSILYQVFSVNNNAQQKTTGLELSLTTPERPRGFSGALSLTYQNAISSVPPLLPGEDELPLVTTQSFQLGDTYRAGFLSPLVLNVGGTYRAGGLHITPSVSFNVGYPTGVGNLVAYNGYINGKAYNVPQTNLGGAQPTVDGYDGVTGPPVATNYVDPAYVGSILNPNIAASRGEKETSAAGGELSRPYATGNLTVEYTFAKHQTIGLAVDNITGQIYAGSTPQVNTYYQPVTTGVAGPNTGQVAQANPALASSYGNHGFSNIPNSSYGSNAFLLIPNAPTTYRAYYQVKL